MLLNVFKIGDMIFIDVPGVFFSVREARSSEERLSHGINSLSLLLFIIYFIL